MSSLKTTNPSNDAITQIKINPWDHNLISVSGDNIFKLIRFTEGHLKQIGTHKLDFKEKNFTDHCWLNLDRLALLSQFGEIYIFDNGDLKDTINLNLVVASQMELPCKSISNDSDSTFQEYGRATITRMEIKKVAAELNIGGSCITALPTGFLVSDTAGTTFIFELDDARISENFYLLIKKIKIPMSSIYVDQEEFIEQMTPSPTGELLIARSNKRMIYSFPLATARLDNLPISDYDIINHRGVNRVFPAKFDTF